MPELVPINILIGDRTYRIRTSPEDEETVRKTVKLINDKIVEFKTQFAGKDMQDYIAMVIIWYATQTQAGGNSAAQNEAFMLGLQKLEALLDKTT
ncbi:MAG TPA: cell division protein ZapA [Chitinophagaceae bacterium]|nr:cell division protein ZapA [Chitinophagaceae bacterium]HCY89759.1 cell division protein ZapA [Chitinophagaceae bacterium]HRF26133.1 cell division protein ZapA [Ferruginibacter sp.]